jgi:transketolase
MPKYDIKLAPDAEKIATRKSFGEALVKLGAKYGGIVVLDADLSCSVQTAKFAAEYPDRHFNMGIAEQNMVGAAAGFAARGKIPFACSFSIFSTGRPWEIIRNSVCYPNLNVKILGSHAGVLTGEDGASHQALEDIAIMRVLPNMKIVQPADHYEALSVMEKVVSDFGPTYIRVLRGGTPLLYSGVREGDTPVDFEFGKSDVLMGGDMLAGSKKADLCVFATGALVGASMYAAQRIEEEDGKKIIVVNVSSIKPIDSETILECAGKAKLCVTAEDHNVIGGLAGAVSEVFAENGVGVKLVKIGMQDKFGESGKTADLYKKYGFDADGVYKTLKGL